MACPCSYQTEYWDHRCFHQCLFSLENYVVGIALSSSHGCDQNDNQPNAKVSYSESTILE